jgi:hypothetical protein
MAVDLQCARLRKEGVEARPPRSFEDLGRFDGRR